MVIVISNHTHMTIYKNPFGLPKRNNSKRMLVENPSAAGDRLELWITEQVGKCSIPEIHFEAISRCNFGDNGLNVWVNNDSWLSTWQKKNLRGHDLVIHAFVQRNDLQNTYKYTISFMNILFKSCNINLSRISTSKSRNSHTKR